jgi:hypothetical protein
MVTLSAWLTETVGTTFAFSLRRYSENNAAAAVVACCATHKNISYAINLHIGEETKANG